MHRGEAPLDPCSEHGPQRALRMAWQACVRGCSGGFLIASQTQESCTSSVLRGHAISTTCVDSGAIARPCAPGAAGTPAHQQAWEGHSQHSRCLGREQLGEGLHSGPAQACSFITHAGSKEVEQREHL